MTLKPETTVIMVFAFRKIETVPWWFVPSHAIGWVTGGRYSHVEGVFPDGLWFGAVGKGLRFTDKIGGNKDKWDFIEIEMTLAKVIFLRQLCEIDRGKEYDYNGVMSYILPITQSGNKAYCSEIWRDYLGRTGIGLLPFWMGEKCPPDAKGKKYKGLYELLMQIHDRQVREQKQGSSEGGE